MKLGSLPGGREFFHFEEGSGFGMSQARVNKSSGLFIHRKITRVCGLVKLATAYSVLTYRGNSSGAEAFGVTQRYPG